jgi:hypothetical protein
VAFNPSSGPVRRVIGVFNTEVTVEFDGSP